MTTLTWKDLLKDEKQTDYFKKIINFIEAERAKGKIIYPENKNIFNALQLTSFEDCKVVILGQDPYHGPNQAHGLCFSVNHGIPKPPSLKNIFKELKSDLQITEPTHGCLSGWAEQGVLLLNTVLSVEAGNANSHANMGWEIFTDKIISLLNEHKRGLIFMLWGAPAQRKVNLLDQKKHFILKAPHPSPLSAHRGFLGCKHFSKANDILQELGCKCIDWGRF
jgi:uracil-DNA glycosylase